jgi:hypothetical protein
VTVAGAQDNQARQATSADGDDGGGQPGESSKERLDRELIELLNEIRVALPGIQVLFAFLFAAPFAQGWRRVTETQETMFVIAILAAALATACLIAPTTFHRLNFRQGAKEQVLRISNVLVLAGTLMLSVAMAAAVFVVCELIMPTGSATALALLTGGVMVLLWFAGPLALRGRGTR